jgi:hypothetical protein
MKIFMKIRYQLLIAILLLGVCVLSGCTDEEYIFLNHGSVVSSSCPNNAWCEEHLYTNDVVYLEYVDLNETVRIEYT